VNDIYKVIISDKNNARSKTFLIKISKKLLAGDNNEIFKILIDETNKELVNHLWSDVSANGFSVVVKPVSNKAISTFGHILSFKHPEDVTEILFNFSMTRINRFLKFKPFGMYFQLIGLILAILGVIRHPSFPFGIDCIATDLVVAVYLLGPVLFWYFVIAAKNRIIWAFEDIGFDVKNCDEAQKALLYLKDNHAFIGSLLIPQRKDNE
jgi:hypothetical protein